MPASPRPPRPKQPNRSKDVALLASSEASRNDKAPAPFPADRGPARTSHDAPTAKAVGASSFSPQRNMVVASSTTSLPFAFSTAFSM